jgi:site-specific recombinase XerD
MTNSHVKLVTPTIEKRTVTPRRPKNATLRTHRGARAQSASSHASARLRLRTGQRRADTRAVQAYLGHRNIQHTVRYTELAPGRFNQFWND